MLGWWNVASVGSFGKGVSPFSSRFLPPAFLPSNRCATDVWHSLKRFCGGHRSRKMHTRVRYRRGQAGFTLIELLIVVAILAILAAILIPNFLRARASSQLATCQLDLRNIAATLELYYGGNQTYPMQATWQNDLITSGYARAVPKSPIDHADYGYETDAGRTAFVLWDGPNKYDQAGINGYVVYTGTGGLQLGVASVPTP